jgi:hypothetical protein
MPPPGAERDRSIQTPSGCEAAGITIRAMAQIFGVISPSDHEINF